MSTQRAFQWERHYTARSIAFCWWSNRRPSWIFFKPVEDLLLRECGTYGPWLYPGFVVKQTKKSTRKRKQCDAQLCVHTLLIAILCSLSFDESTGAYRELFFCSLAVARKLGVRLSVSDKSLKRPSQPIANSPQPFLSQLTSPVRSICLGVNWPGRSSAKSTTLMLERTSSRGADIRIPSSRITREDGILMFATEILCLSRGWWFFQAWT